MSLTHVLIDLDGTISDSSPGIGRSLRAAFAACGYAAPDERQVRAAIGPPFELTFPHLGVAEHDIARVIDAYRVRYEDVGMYENELYPGVVDMLTTLAETFTLAVATAKPEPTARRIIQHFGLDSHFAAVVGASPEVGAGRRTKAEVITHALTVLEIEPGPHAVMVGDRDHDVDGARHNGLDCLGVAWGFGSREELWAAGAAAIVETPAEVVDAARDAYRSGS
jgi:phosphoglycolate phosphatase